MLVQALAAPGKALGLVLWRQQGRDQLRAVGQPAAHASCWWRGAWLEDAGLCGSCGLMRSDVAGHAMQGSGHPLRCPLLS